MPLIRDDGFKHLNTALHFAQHHNRCGYPEVIARMEFKWRGLCSLGDARRFGSPQLKNPATQ
jgi:hypothetical protein